MTPECASAWRNYEVSVNVMAAGVCAAFEEGWTARGQHEKRSASSVGHVCEGSSAGRKPGLCWICGKALPHDCVGGAQPVADRLDGFALLPNAQATHGPPQKVELPTPIPGASILLYPEPANRLAPPIAPPIAHIGRKWPIGTPDEHAWKLTSDGCRDDHGPSYEWHLRLAAARTHRGLTLDALGAKLDPPRTRKDISAMEHGRRGLSVDLCAQLADALDCDRLWLAGWTL